MICPEEPKCSNLSHKDVDASVFCPSCNKFFCESCNKALHEAILRDHQPVPISVIIFGSTIITGKCDVPNHNNNPLNYYCKDHNVPCCGMCLCVKEDIGKHSKCQTVPLKDMEQHMKSTLGNVIKELEGAIKSAKDSFEKIKNVQEENEEAKNETVKQIEANFNAIREAVDARENELLGLVEELWEKESSCEKLIETGTECPEEAKQIVTAAKKIEQHWDTNHLPEMAQHYGLVVDTTKELTNFCSEVDETALKDLKIRFIPEKDGVDAFIDEIKKFGDVFVKFKRMKYTFPMKESPNNKYVLEGPNKSIIRKISDNNWDCTAIGNNTLPLNSITKWDVKIISTSNRYIMVGIAPNDIDQVNAECNCNECGWYFYCCNSALYSGPPHNYDGKLYGQNKKLKNGDVVGVIIDTTTGELSFSVSDENLGVAYGGIPLDKPLVPTIDFYQTNDSVKVMF